VEADRLSITDAISRVADVLRLHQRISFVELLLSSGDGGRPAVIAAFLAVLEMVKLRLLRIYQRPGDEAGLESEIMVEASDTLGEGATGMDGAEEYR
jgi:segregation and condensation protein A